MPKHTNQSQRLGAYRSWANTTDRTARTHRARSSSPGEIEWHLARLDPDRFANASDDDRLKAAEAARAAYFVGLAIKSAAARRRSAS